MRDVLLGVALGAVGILMVLGALTGRYGTAVEMSLWTVIGIAWVVAALAWGLRPWLVVLVAGAVSGVAAGAMQAALLPLLIERNAGWAQYTVDPATRFQAFFTAVAIGVVWGLLFAGVAWLLRLVVFRDAAAPT